MSVATYSQPTPAPRATARRFPAPALSLMLADGALLRLGQARGCLERGADPARHLRTAALQIRELPASLPLPAGDALAVNLADVCEYLCRQLAAVDGAAGLTTLADVCDLLGEIRRACLTLPAPARM
jgi:flagellin-specific chaperone FliS